MLIGVGASTTSGLNSDGRSGKSFVGFSGKVGSTDATGIGAKNIVIGVVVAIGAMMVMVVVVDVVVGAAAGSSLPPSGTVVEVDAVGVDVVVAIGAEISAIFVRPTSSFNSAMAATADGAVLDACAPPTSSDCCKTSTLRSITCATRIAACGFSCFTSFN